VYSNINKNDYYSCFMMKRYIITSLSPVVSVIGGVLDGSVKLACFGVTSVVYSVDLLLLVP
jgi:hypothetical protein